MTYIRLGNAYFDILCISVQGFTYKCTFFHMVTQSYTPLISTLMLCNNQRITVLTKHTPIVSSILKQWENMQSVNMHNMCFINEVAHSNKHSITLNRIKAYIHCWKAVSLITRWCLSSVPINLAVKRLHMTCT